MTEAPLRAIWLAIVVLASAALGVAGGLLSFCGGAGLSNAVLAAGGGFLASATLGIKMLAFMTREKAS